MKKFKLTIRDSAIPGDNDVVYESIITFNEKQEKGFLSKVPDLDNIETEIGVLIEDLPQEEQKKFSGFDVMEDIDEIIEQYPDIAIAAGLRSKCYNILPDILSWEDEWKTSWKGQVTVIKSNLHGISWECTRIE